MITCPYGEPCRYRASSVPFMLLHLQWAHLWTVSRATGWLVNHVEDAMDNGPS